MNASCLHCGLDVLGQSSKFCCIGCETVFGLIQNLGLSRYYDLKQLGTGNVVQPSVDGSETRNSYLYLDDPEFLKLYSDRSRMDFYIEGAHCAACVWLLEKSPEFIPGLHSVRLDLARSVASVQLKDGGLKGGPQVGKFSEVAYGFARLGYRPHPIKSLEAELLHKKENRKFLIRMGVAGACAGNIMLLAISLYSGADGDIGTMLRWLSFVLYLPVFFYSAAPFFKTALGSLRARIISIDVPIVLGILIGSTVSTVNLVRGAEHIYFDSLSALVFLLLASRFVLRRAQQAALNSSNLIHFLTPTRVKRITQNRTIEEVSVQALQKGDLIQVPVGEAIPVDGQVAEGKSALNCAVLTGESDWKNVQEGDFVFAGTVNQTAPLGIRVLAAGAKTRLGQIIQTIEEQSTRKAPIVALLDRFGRYFIVALLSLIGLVLLSGFKIGLQAAMDRAMGLAIVACPCAFALGAPLAMAVTIGRAARLGILIKGADIVERLSQVNSVFLDKTGTLTTGSFQVLRVTSIGISETELKRVALALEERSVHPTAKAIVSAFRANTPSSKIEISDFAEKVGKGVSGTIDGHKIQIHRSRRAAQDVQQTGTEIEVLRDDQPIGYITLGDTIRRDSPQAIGRMKDLGLTPYLLSGDRKSSVLDVARTLNIPTENCFYEKTPEEKCDLVQSHARSLMVGDGANDAPALSSAHVGVAVQGGLEVSLRAADVYISRPGVNSIADLVVLSKEAMWVLYRNLFFSVFYNLIGISFVLAGKVGPLLAAVLMPVSAISVFISSMVGTRVSRRILS